MVGSEMSANRVMRNISRFIEAKLGLKVNVSKSKVDKPQGLEYLGFGFCFDSRARQYKAKPHAKSVMRFKRRMKELTCRIWGVSNVYKVEQSESGFYCKRNKSKVVYRFHIFISYGWQ